MGLHPELIKLIGPHEVPHQLRSERATTTPSRSPSWPACMAAEIGVDVATAKRAGLLHDLGKAVDHEIEGSHVTIGVELARKYKESKEVIHAIHAHHNDVEPQTVIACLVQAADAISAARPGARRENLENYIKRLEKLEEVTYFLPRRREILRHPGRPRGPHHRQARSRQRGRNDPPGQGHRQADRGRAGIPRPDQSASAAGSQGRRVRKINHFLSIFPCPLDGFVQGAVFCCLSGRIFGQIFRFRSFGFGADGL